MRDHAPHCHAGTQTFIAGLRYDRLVAPWILSGPMVAVAFETWVETQLLPTLRKEDVVILDNLAVHKSPKAAAMLRARGAWFLFLPKYSPESQSDQDGLRQAQGAPAPHRRPHPDDLWRAVGEICDLFDPDECWNYFKKAGYVSK